MYTLVSALGHPTTPYARWEAVDAGTRLPAVYRDYRSVVITVQPDFQAEVMHVDMAQFKLKYALEDLTLDEFMVALRTETFTTQETLPNKRVSYAQYGYANYAGYVISRAKAGRHLDPLTPEEDFTDLALYRNGDSVDLRKLHTHCLLSVNGFYHMTEEDRGVTYIKEGGTNARHSKHNAVGILSFIDVGELTKHAIRPEMVQAGGGLLSMKDGVEVRLPEGEELGNFFLVLGGYLVFPQENVMWAVDDRTLRINFARIPYLDRIDESRHYLDLKDMELSESTLGGDIVNIPELMSDRVIKNYFCLSQSYVVSVKSGNLFMSRLQLRQAAAPGVFSFNEEPRYPMFLGSGRVAEYRKLEERERWGLYVQDGFRRNPMYYHTVPPKLESVADQLSFQRPFYFSDAYMLEIGSYNN